MELLSANCGREILFSDNVGSVYHLDLTAKSCVGKFKGSVGSVTGIECDGKRVVVGGMDRYVRVYDLKTRRLHDAIYTKQRVSALAVHFSDLTLVSQVDAEVDKDGDEIWKRLPRVADQPRKRTHASAINGNVKNKKVNL